MSRHPKFFRSLHCRIAIGLTLLVWAATITPTGSAQEERPQIQPGERKAPRKKNAEPRAVAVLRLGDNGKASLVPIAILINGKFWDASAYKADPVPMALESGTVYEAERAGSSMGLFTVNTALHSNAANAPVPWIATGAWHPAGADEPKPAQKAESAPVGIDTTDQPPRLTHDPAKTTLPANTSPGTSAAPASGTAPASNAPPAAPSKPSSGGDEPPRLSKRNSTSDAPGSPAPPGGSAPNRESPKSEKKPASIEADDRPSVPASDSGTREASRPRLRRGKPAESFADEDVPGYSRPNARPASSTDGGKIVVAAAAAKSDVKLIPAISDAAGPTPHSFDYEWLKGEEGDRRKQITELAKQQVQAYVIAQSKAKITPLHPQPAKNTVLKMKEPILENEQMVAYDLWNSNQPVMIFSAEAHLPPPPPGSAHSDVDSDLQYSVLVVAYPDIYNNLHKLYAGVTDKFHLDITPRLELVDAVDADGDNRGELLFLETSDAGSGWVIYRATADKLYKMFDGLNPE